MKRVLIGAAALVGLAACSSPVDPKQQAVEAYVEKVWTLVDECQDEMRRTQAAMATADVSASRIAAMNGHAVCQRVVGEITNIREPDFAADVVDLLRESRAEFGVAQATNAETLKVIWKGLEDNNPSYSELRKVERLMEQSKASGLQGMTKLALATNTLGLDTDRIGALMAKVEDQ